MFWKECRKILFGIPFVILLLATVLMYSTQLGSAGFLEQNDKLEAPVPGEAFGTTASNDPDLIMPEAVSSLLMEFNANAFTTYPVAFVRTVTLSRQDMERMADLLSQLTGDSKETLLAGTGQQTDNSITIGADGVATDADGNVTVNGDNSFVAAVPSYTRVQATLAQGLTYGRFTELMTRADELLGGGSAYSPEKLNRFGAREKTYEEALAEYEAARDIDGFSGAYARLFADYMCLMACLLPAFVAVAEGLRDKRAHIRELVWSRRISSLSLVCSRYFALVLVCFLPTLLLAVFCEVRVSLLYAGESIQPLAFLTYSLGWILPSVMISAAIGLFFTELTDTPVGLALMVFYWFMELNRSLTQMHGGYEGFPLSPRHNSMYGAEIFAKQFSELAANRILFAAISLILVGAAALILDQKRKGSWRTFSGFSFSRRKTLMGQADEVLTPTV